LTELRRIPVFSDCSTRELKKVASLGTLIRVETGRELTVAGAPGLEWFVVLSGQASCRVPSLEVATFGPGDSFGELSLLDGGVRSASVVAETPMKVLAFNRSEFACLLEVAPSVTRRVLTALAIRLRAADLTIGRLAVS
jgi:CRP-like cAMP-binding protein